MASPSSYAFIGWKTYDGSVSNQRTSALPPRRGMMPRRVPRSGSHENAPPRSARRSKLNTSGQRMKITWSFVIAKSCIIDGQATSMTSLRTSAPSAAATWYVRYGGDEPKAQEKKNAGSGDGL